MNRKVYFEHVKRIVVKAGTNILVDNQGELYEDFLNNLAEDLSSLKKEGKEIVMVTSGAVRTGVFKLGYDPLVSVQNTQIKQAAAAVGQVILMQKYQEILKKFGLWVAQVMVTRSDFRIWEKYLNILNTFNYLLKNPQVIPIVNENDTISTEGIEFGENDTLAAFIANKIEADVLIFLSNIPGVYSGDPKDPRQQGSLEFIPVIENITPEMEQAAQHARMTKGSRGGMYTKLQACKMAMNFGIYTVIAHGHEKNVVRRILHGEEVGTLFLPGKRQVQRRRNRKNWLAHALFPKGRIKVDSGAKAAICHQGASLLPSGIKEVEGNFVPGDLVSVVDLESHEIARGLVSYSSEEIMKIKGAKSGEIKARLGYERGEDEVIHRDNLVLLV
ncbi:MAG TPA: glutamate 5-kinase [Candidatus Limnocylindrales bacterium]|nr:glutamate 5-kinase [Candidatus Limnocylindrales bacterium]